MWGGEDATLLAGEEIGGNKAVRGLLGVHRLKPTNAPITSKTERRNGPFQAALATLVNITESGKFGGLAGRLLDGPVHLPSY